MSTFFSKSSLIRQGSWMVLATLSGGVFMTAVHAIAGKKMVQDEYGVFQALLRIFLLLGIPAAGLQIVFAQQAAAAVTDSGRQQLASTMRAVMAATFVIWLLFILAAIMWREDLIASFKLTNPAALWLTVLLGLTSLWIPIQRGVLQGQQNFLKLGITIILEGVARFGVILVILYFGGQAAGGVLAVVLAQVFSLLLGGAFTLQVWTGAGAPFPWRPWLKKVIPLTGGVAVVLIMTNSDVLYVASSFPKSQSAAYSAAAMIGFAFFMFISPLAAVMFPKIVQSAAQSGTSAALRHTLGATALVGGLAGVSTALFPELPLRVVYGLTSANYWQWQASPLVPWFVWSLLPLVLANVLIGNLLARERFKVVAPLLGGALAYGIMLSGLRTAPSLDSPLFTTDEIRNVRVMIAQINQQSNGVEKYLFERFSDQAPGLLSASKTKPQEFVYELNRIIQGPPILQNDLAPFARLLFLKGFFEINPDGSDTLLLNRSLLQAMFPTQVAGTQPFADFKRVIQTMGLCNVFLLAIAIGFTARGKRTANPRE